MVINEVCGGRWDAEAEVGVVVVVVVSRADTKLQAFSSRHRSLPTPERGERGVATAFRKDRPM